MHPLLWQVYARSERLLFHRSPMNSCWNSSHPRLAQMQFHWQDLEGETKAVERIRAEMRQSTDVVSLVDYGSGSGFNPAQGNQPITRTRKISEIVNSAAAPTSWGRLLMAHIRATSPSSLLELGTNLGIGAHFIGLAKDPLASFVTIEGDPTLSMLASRHLTDIPNLRLEVGRFSDVLPAILTEIPPIDWAYIDGHHDGKATVDYFHQLKNGASSGCWMFFDDIRWSEAMFRAWQSIRKDESVAFAFDLGKMGLIQLK